MALNISRGRIWKAQKVTIYGPEGIGKSSFASDFPDPIFIDTEGSTYLMDVARFPRPSSWTMLLSMIKQVATTPGCCKTLVIDTIDWAEQLCVSHVYATYDKKGIEDFGYGKGYVFVKEEIGRFLNLLSDVIEAGINVVLTAHSTIRKFELPDECGSFDRYELKLGNKTGSQTSALVKEWADMVLFANYKQYVVEVEKKKKAQGGTRVMYTQHHPCWDAKNRHDLAEQLPFEYARISYCIPNHADAEPTKAAESAAPATPAPAPAEPTVNPPEAQEKSTFICSRQSSNESKEDIMKLANDFVESSKNRDKENSPGDLKDLPKPLADLMAANAVTIKEIQHVVSTRGYYPQDTPIVNYDPGFIDGVLVGAWEQVFEMIQMERAIPFN